MMAKGWIEEVENLIPNWNNIVMPAKMAIGYEQIKNYIDNGKKLGEFEHLIELVVNKTMQFSRRQRKWFERDPRISWIDCDELAYDEIVERAYLICE